jgi:hypothetical protein
VGGLERHLGVGGGILLILPEEVHIVFTKVNIPLEGIIDLLPTVGRLTLG